MLTSADDLRARRKKLADLLGQKAVRLDSGAPVPRNYPGNPYPFRASSHFLYFCGWSAPNTTVLLQNGEATLYHDFRSPDDVIWEGPGPSADELQEKFGFDAILPAAEAPLAATIQDPDVAEAVIELRLTHDEAAQKELRRACRETAECHEQARAVIAAGVNERQVKAELLRCCTLLGGVPAFNPIVSRCGEVLHNHESGNVLENGDLLLIDFGVESETGWAGDITRTWPVGPEMTPRQKEIYSIVDRAQKECIQRCTPGREYRDIHLHAALRICEGLVNLGLLRGNPSSLVEQGAHALFFPHGVGHLLGLDVHDMEDLGDRAGYAKGRERSRQFGLNYLRLDRPLRAGMAVTIEPGFYWIPGILEDPERTGAFGQAVHMQTVYHYREVRGIRIEDDVLVTENGPNKLT